MAFSFTIPANAISNGVPAANTEVTFDRGFTRSSSHRILTASFGDGYEQRALDGINTKMETFNVSFNSRPATEINLFTAFFDKKASLSFNLTITRLGGDETIRVICENYNTSYIYEDFHNLTATLRRVYEPND